VLLPDREKYEKQIMFSTTGIVDHHCTILFHTVRDDFPDKANLIKIWSPFLIDDEDDADTTASLINILKHPSLRKKKYTSNELLEFELSHDKSMIAVYIEAYCIHDDVHNVSLYSIDSDNKSVTLIHSISVTQKDSDPSIRFTPDDKYLCYVDRNRLAFWDITAGRETTEKIQTSYNKIDKIGPVCFSPAGTGQHLLVKEKGGYCIASYWESNNKVQMPATGVGGAETTAAVDRRALSHGNGEETKENKVQMPATGACN
jgi:hypothetical protein